MIVKKILLDKANRMYQMPPDLLAFAQSERKRKLLKRPETIDLATFAWPVEIDYELPSKAESFRPAGKKRIDSLKEELAGWMTAVHRTKLIGTREIFIGGSITELIHNLALAFIDYGDVTFVPELAVPLYRQAVTACNGEAISYTVDAHADWKPSFDRIRTQLGQVARFLFLNSPHNPTGTILGDKDMAELVWMAGRENILIVNDAAYQGVPDRLPTSLLAVEGGKKVGVEVYSFAYRFGLPALPFGFVVGNRDIINGLEMAAGLRPSSIPDYYVEWALQAIRRYPAETLRQVRTDIRQTAAESAGLLDKLSLTSTGLSGTPFVWARIERRSNAVTAARMLYRRYRILSVPGTAFGDSGQGFLRFSLTAGTPAFKDATTRVKRKIKLLRQAEAEE